MLTENDISVEALQYYEEHPIDFIQDINDIALDKWQRDVTNALIEYHFVAIRSGNGVGKTCLLSNLLLWFLCTKPNCRVPTTAPTQHQLFDLLWAECYKWINKSSFLTALLNWTQTRIGIRGHEPDWYAVARTASVSPGGETAEGLAGFHAEDNLLFIVDEGSAVPDQVYAAVEGAFTGENAYCIITSNPTRRTGYFYDIFHNPKISHHYQKFHVSGYDSPRVSKRFVEMMREKYGENHPLYRIKVLGEFPTADEDLMFPPEYVDAMMNTQRDMSVSPKMDVELGIDLGLRTASAVCCVRQGFNILDFIEKKRYSGANETRDLLSWVSDVIHDYSPRVVRVDAVGIGDPLCDLLEELFGDLIVRVIGQASAPDKDVYLNLRAQGYWHLFNIMSKLYCKNWPDRLITEMSDIRRRYTTRGKLHVETKEEMRARSLRSPDFLDSMVYAFIEAADFEPAFNPIVPKNFGDMNKEFEHVGCAWRLHSSVMHEEKRGWFYNMNSSSRRVVH